MYTTFTFQTQFFPNVSLLGVQETSPIVKYLCVTAINQQLIVDLYRGTYDDLINIITFVLLYIFDFFFIFVKITRT